MTLTERIQTYLETYADHLGRKVTKSSPLTLQTARKRLYFSDFKERLVHFNGTVVILLYECFSIASYNNSSALIIQCFQTWRSKLVHKDNSI